MLEKYCPFCGELLDKGFCISKHCKMHTMHVASQIELAKKLGHPFRAKIPKLEDFINLK